jgi:hypothetical protein
MGKVLLTVLAAQLASSFVNKIYSLLITHYSFGTQKLCNIRHRLLEK